MDSHQHKIVYAYLDKNIDKLEKYLERGAEIGADNDRLYKLILLEDDVETMKMVIGYEIRLLKQLSHIIAFGFYHDSFECLKYLSTIINVDDYKNSCTYDMLMELHNTISVC
jgi:hypothetical protein